MSSTHNPKKAPILETLQACTQRCHAPFYTPGHKHGRGMPQELTAWLGLPVFQADLPELPELDNLFSPQSVIQEAQELAAETFGADRTWFLVNGSTSGIVAAILATCSSGDKIILPRTVHRSVISGLILSGAMPIFINPEYDPVWDLAWGMGPEAVEGALNEHPDAKAVMVVYPTYQGVCSDIEAIARVCRDRDVLLLADEAHGPHFTFHRDLPMAALAAGADVSVQSIHKVLGALTQASMVHVKGDRLDPDRLSASLQLLTSSSPSYLLLASLDAARRQMALDGEALMEETLKLGRSAQAQIAAIPGLRVLDGPSAPTSGFTARDRTRIVVNVSELGLSGYEADELLDEKFGVVCELPLPKTVTFIVSLGNTQTDIDRLVAGLEGLARQFRREGACGGDRPPLAFPELSPKPLCLSPRDAFFAPVETIRAIDAVNRISAELVCPYPPGIPILMPGEAICAAAIDYLHAVKTRGALLTGCSDPSFQTVQVVQE
ncbi:MAG: aminotransferase class I/II-fold pyridoxal phosphate-dependent enzyme [Cyanobacteria bacterium J007]|nr:MAG: aminotransferase class I/II-fold pyridoxal phosphate-dependent enzyme [Cyanobacteria bacterium J007]